MIDETGMNTPHNAANDMQVTALVARGWDHLAAPLAEHVFRPLGEWNRTVGLVALNASLTAPRLIEPLVGKWYESGLKSGKRGQAVAALAVSAGLAFLDGLDGSAARQSNLTSEGGAIADPAVDLAASASISRQVERLAHAEDDTLTVLLMRVRMAVDGAAIVGAVANGAATKYAEAQGVQIAEQDQAKANAPSKIKFALGTAGSVAIRASYLLPQKYATPVKRVGQGLVIGAIGVGGQGGYQYAASAVSKLRQGFVAKRQAA